MSPEQKGYNRYGISEAYFAMRMLASAHVLAEHLSAFDV